MDNSIITSIRAIIETADKMSGCYWFAPPPTADGRRRYEARFSHPVVTWIEGGHEYSAAYTLRCSCRNVYGRGEYTRDGKKTTLRAIRNSYARLAVE